LKQSPNFQDVAGLLHHLVYMPPEPEMRKREVDGQRLHALRYAAHCKDYMNFQELTA
jgi:hypothetical protein